MKNTIMKSAGLPIVPFNVNFKRLPEVKDDETCLIMSYLEMVFQDYPKGFTKFIKDCDEQRRLIGRSFTKELRINTRTFREAFKKIGVAYRSHQQYSRAKDKFKNKFYCSITDPLNENQTLYLRNHELMNTVFRFISRTP